LKLDGKVSGLVRVVLYLEDLGVVKRSDVKSQASNPAPIQAANSVEDQIVWQLEMWKRAEMAKFLAHLKQKEIEKVDELAQEWKFKEQQREQSFNEAVTKVTALENKVRVKATDLQRREERII
jgi:hypothetical protein